MRKRSNMRFLNGVVCAAIVCFFAIHGLLGSFAPVAAFTNPLRWVVWVGVAFVAIHVVLSIVTSYEQMTDADFPPSPRKKRHLVLKWVTGTLLALVVCLHIASFRIPGVFSAVPMLPTLVTVALAGALAVHIWVGAKSLLTDVGLSKRLMTPFRVIVCALAIAFAAAAFAGVAGVVI